MTTLASLATKTTQLDATAAICRVTTAFYSKVNALQDVLTATTWLITNVTSVIRAAHCAQEALKPALSVILAIIYKPVHVLLSARQDCTFR